MTAYKVTEKTGKLSGMMTAGDDEDVMVINLAGTVIRIRVADISLLGRSTSGVKLMKASEDNPVIGFTTVAQAKEDSDTAGDGAEAASENGVPSDGDPGDGLSGIDSDETVCGDADGGDPDTDDDMPYDDEIFGEMNDDLFEE